ncbi:MAG: pyridoxamine 5'-phosphate oxidase family protein [Deltaproteobacteria bacterium]|nr:pyridoxamine 5'-phosphate oxidase family protein [Deltaproteobacteria bacterium]
MNNKKEQLLQNTCKLLKSQYFGVLATQGEIYPHTSLVAFCVSPDFSGINFCTARSTRKFANLSAHPMVSLLIDNRSNKTTDLNLAASLSATGQARELIDAARRKAQAGFLSRHPDLQNFCNLPDTAICTIEIKAFQLVYNFQETVSCLPAELTEIII